MEPPGPEQEILAVRKRALAAPGGVAAEIGRLADMVSTSVANAKAFFDAMCQHNWDLVARCLCNTKTTGPMLRLLCSLTRNALDDVAGGGQAGGRHPLANITNSTRILAKTNDFDFVQAKVFTKADGMMLLENDAVIRTLAGTVGSRKPLLALLSTMCELAHVYNRRSIYDSLSSRLLAAGVYVSVLDSCQKSPLSAEEEGHAVGVFELAAASAGGVQQLCTHLGLVLDTLQRQLRKSSASGFLSLSSERIETSTMTVLLDLTANEVSLETTAAYLARQNLFDPLLRRLSGLLHKSGRHTLPAVQNRARSRKLKDLIAGVILNVSCNVDGETVKMNMLEKGIVPILLELLFDPRHDWPTNGAALALLQYSHMSMSNLQVYQRLSGACAMKIMEGYYMLEPATEESRRNVHEATVLLGIAERKQQSVARILSKMCLAPAA